MVCNSVLVASGILDLVCMRLSTCILYVSFCLYPFCFFSSSLWEAFWINFQDTHLFPLIVTIFNCTFFFLPDLEFQFCNLKHFLYPIFKNNFIVFKLLLFLSGTFRNLLKPQYQKSQYISQRQSIIRTKIKLTEKKTQKTKKHFP